jgi:hypothetical protein
MAGNDQRRKAMDEKRFKDAREKKSPWNEGWVGALMGLLLIAGAILSVGGASKSAAVSTVPAATFARSGATASAPASQGSYAIADRDVLDMQLD